MIAFRKAVLPQDEAELFQLNLLLSPDETIARFREDLNRAADSIFVATERERILAFTSFSYPHWDNIALAIHLVVQPEQRGNTLGTQLLTQAVDAARQSGCRFFTIRTASWNEKAIRFYERNGFVPRAVFANYIGDGNDMVWLEQDLRTEK
ncbi:MAG: GNAT family N-acetyltransferase [Oligoflexia bacterium]|nr:GNAT family N-acetyltransferase [Oligoflexia bacterium]